MAKQVNWTYPENKTHWKYIKGSGHPIKVCPKCGKSGYISSVRLFDTTIKQRVTHHGKTCWKI